MGADISIATAGAAPPRPPVQRFGARRWRRSLQLRLVVSAVVLVGAMSLLLFAGIDRLVSQHFTGLHDERERQIGHQIEQTLVEEGQRLLDLVQLAATDVDLIHATYYHLHLQGERRHPQQALQRVADALRLESTSLRAPDGHPLALTGLAWPADGATSDAAVAVVQQGGEAWLVAQAPVRRLGEPLAGIAAARSLEPVLERLARTSQASLSVAPAREPANLHVERLGPRPLALRLTVPDTASQALRTAQHLLAAMLAVSGLALAAGLAWFTRRELAPLAPLADAAAAIGRGELGEQVVVRGHTEIADLVGAFNEMSRKLADARRVERQLQQQERLSMIGRVAARVAHDLNNPLTVISNTARLLQRELPAASDDARADLDLVHHHAQRCSRIVAELLDQGRPLHLVPTPVDLVPWIDEVATRWSAAAGGRPVTCTHRVDRLPVHADVLQLERCVDNLLDNAAQAAPDGRVEIVLDADADARGRRALICVRDDGPGFAPEAREHLFEPFYTTKAGGSGLGLASCRTVARAHGGDVEVAAGARGEVVLWLPR